ncbi:MAG TPA: hypothetical protein VK642_07365 [Burkholderiales bacterium]|nr:hypothetical protein [Burkholderiales bacterium]
MSGTMRVWLAIVIAMFLHGCATYQPIPEGYTGPVALVADSGVPESGTRARIFALMEIDGNKITNAFSASANASQGQGFRLTTKFVSRPLPARPMKVKLLASHTTAAPIHALFSQAAGNFFSVEGVVDFVPEPGGEYVVKGDLKKDGSSVWIEDIRTKQPVTQKIVEK